MGLCCSLLGTFEAQNPLDEQELFDLLVLHRRKLVSVFDTKRLTESESESESTSMSARMPSSLAEKSFYAQKGHDSPE